MTAEKFIGKALSSLLLALWRTEKAKNALRGRNQSRAFQKIPEARSQELRPNLLTLRAKSQELRANLYRTGDLARWQPDGNIEFLGRIDDQVNIRGYRIEPGEIQSRLLEHENIKEAVVIGRKAKKGDEYLCAYIVAKRKAQGAGQGAVESTELREYLSKDLPAYMIPSYFVPIEKILLTSNGKLNQKALPEPGVGKYEPGKKYVAPRNELEEKLAGIWSEVLLGKDALHETPSPIGIDDSFFESGGHSLKATVLLARIHKELNVEIPLPEIFIRPTIRGLGEFIRGKALDRFAPIEPTENKEYYPLSSAQKRIYILQQADLTSTAYNIPQNVVIKGDPGRKRLKETFMKLIQRHESLRTSFHIVGEEPVQRIHDEVAFEIEYYDLQVEGAGDRCRWENEGTRGLAPLPLEPASCNSQPEKALISSFIRPFDLSCAPLVRVGLIHTPRPLRGHPRRGTYNSQEGNSEDRYIFMLDMHHIISDGASMAICVREFMAFYEEKELPGLRIQYKNFAEWQNHPATSGKIKKQEEYWLRQFEGEIPMLNLPVDSSRTTAYHSQGTAVFFEIGNQLIANVKQLIGETGTTAYMVLLAVYNILLSKYTGQEDIIVGSGIAGRRHADLQSVIGMFVNMLAMRNRPEENKTFMEFLDEVKKNALKAYENQDYQFDLLVETLGVEREFGRNPIFDTQFTFQNLAEQDRGEPPHKMPGLKVEPYEYGNEKKKMQFDLSLNGIETGENIVMTLEYVTAFFKESTIREMAGHYLEILDQVVEDTNIKLRDINVSHDLLTGKSMLKEEDSLDYEF
jgi:acyl carrier protein